MTLTTAKDWHPTACILCECNCGIEVRLGADGRSFERIRGDKAHPASHGCTCEKALRLDHYQNGRHRLTSPMRRRADGNYEAVDWDTAIAGAVVGVAPNELTSSDHRDPIAGTPYHKHVPARLEPLPAP
jgi:anaerobic selenocysteine-containing dehydrogenase